VEINLEKMGVCRRSSWSKRFWWSWIVWNANCNKALSWRSVFSWRWIWL